MAIKLVKNFSQRIFACFNSGVCFSLLWGRGKENVFQLITLFCLNITTIFKARYYAISSIYRPFDENIDKQASGGNTVTEVNYAVNKQYCFGEINGKPYVNCVDIETIVVTDKFVGFVR